MARPGASLRAYGWIFAAAGAAFVLAPDVVSSILARASSRLPGAAPIAQEGRTYWLVLAGSMMAMIAQLAFRVSREPDRSPAWSTLLLSKAASTGLFLAFAAWTRNSLFLLGAAIDGAILAHLAHLCGGAWERGGAAPWFEVWFLRARDPKTGATLWLRHAEHRGAAPRTELWWTLFDPAVSGVLSGRAVEPAPEPAPVPAAPALARSALLERPGEPGWRLEARWGDAPSFRFAPFTAAAGLAPARYECAAPDARVDGEARIMGRRVVFAEAPASIGHIAGSRGARHWRWLHAALTGPAGTPQGVLEVLSARTAAWPFSWLTGVHLFLDGRHLRSDGPLRLALNRSARAGDSWEFSTRLAGFELAGRCAQDPLRLARFDYLDDRGRTVRVATSMTGRLELNWGRRRWRVEGGAAVEFGGGEA